eukprot:1990326-Pyramimonas_sp.AAC.1
MRGRVRNSRSLARTEEQRARVASDLGQVLARDPLGRVYLEVVVHHHDKLALVRIAALLACMPTVVKTAEPQWKRYLMVAQAVHVLRFVSLRQYTIGHLH